MKAAKILVCAVVETEATGFLEHGTLASSETNDCRFGTKIPTEVLLERFEAGPPLEAIGATHASENL